MRLSLLDLIEAIKNTDNPVTRWSLKVCIIDRLERQDYS